jgi:hypothetical protein
MTDEKRESMLGKVRALLAKAASTPHPGEAEVFRQKADELMTKYAIDEWMLEQEQEGTSKKPVLRTYDMSWRYNGDYDHPARSALWNIFYDVGAHCRIKIVSTKSDYRAQTVPLVGMEADLDYFDLLFTNLMIQLLSQADPKPSNDLSFEENIAAMREAGMDWGIITRRLIDADMLEDPLPGYIWYDQRKDWKEYQKERYNLSQKVVKTYRDYCKRTGREQTYTNVKTFREFFSDAFANEIGTRLYVMARGSEEAYSKSDSPSDSFALAIRDIKQQVQEALWDFFPDLRPHPANCDCPNCHYRKCNDSDCQRPMCVERRKPVKASRVRSRKIPERAVDHQAIAAGREAGRKAKLTATNPSGGLKQRREIEE